MGLSDKDLRALLPSDKDIGEFELKNETKRERELINLFYAVKKYAELTGNSYTVRHGNFPKLVKWAVRHYISKE